jgi:single-strand DNA-binding protein
MNKCIITGNLTRDPELRTTTSGISVCSFTVAVNRRGKRDEQQEVDYFNVTAWRERGETCAKYLSKGKKVLVTGQVSVRTWEKDEKHGASLEVVADEVEFLTPREQTQEQPKNTEKQQSAFLPVEPDDLPF